MNKKQLIVAGIFFVFCSLLITNSYAGFQYYGENQGSFLCGLWDGLKSLVTITLNAFWNDANVYNLNNNGFLYNFGFFILVLSAVAIPLFIIAWIIELVLFLVILFIDFVFHR